MNCLVKGPGSNIRPGSALLLAVAILAIIGQPCSAQGQTAAQSEAAPASRADPAAPLDNQAQPASAETSAEWAVAPIPVLDPTVGKGLAGVGLYTFQLNTNDKVSPPSIVGGGGFRTSNGSWGVAGGAKLYLKEDRFRILAAAGTARLNYTFYGIGNESGEEAITIPITQRGSGFLVGGQVRVVERWYLGSRYYYFNVNTARGEGNDEPSGPIDEIQFDVPVTALALHVQRDARENQFSPKSGSVLDSKIYFSSQPIGALFTYQDYGIAFQQYFSLGKRQVLAYRVRACAIEGRAPFFALCSLGNAADLRGYPVGRYRDRRMLVGQAEYRRALWWRFGAVAFAGAGEVASSFDAFTTSNIRPSAGLGLRFAVAPKNRINFRVDYAIGQGSHAWYVGVAEAF